MSYLLALLLPDPFGKLLHIALLRADALVHIHVPVGIEAVGAVWAPGAAIWYPCLVASSIDPVVPPARQRLAIVPAFRVVHLVLRF